MKQYCSIPTNARITKSSDIRNRLVTLFKPYGADEWIGGGIGYDHAIFNVTFMARVLSFEIPMPSLYDWVFYEASQKEMAEKFEQLGCDYDPMRCIPEDVSRAWYRLLFYRVDRMLDVIEGMLGRVNLSGSFESVFSGVKYEFDGDFQLSWEGPSFGQATTRNGVEVPY
jgi:hypothetical protein